MCLVVFRVQCKVSRGTLHQYYESMRWVVLSDTVCSPAYVHREVNLGAGTLVAVAGHQDSLGSSVFRSGCWCKASLSTCPALTVLFAECKTSRRCLIRLKYVLHGGLSTVMDGRDVGPNPLMLGVIMKLSELKSVTIVCTFSLCNHLLYHGRKANCVLAVRPAQSPPPPLEYGSQLPASCPAVSI